MNFTKVLSQCVQQADASFHRQLVVLSGDRTWAHHSLIKALEPFENSTLFAAPLWLTAEPWPSIRLPFTFLASNKANGWLGSSSSLIVCDLYEGFNPDALAAISGTLIGGGVMILITPPLDAWPAYEDPDYQRMLVYPQTVASIKGRFIQWIRQQIVVSTDVVTFSQTRDGSAEVDLGESPRIFQSATGLKSIDQQVLDPQTALVSAIVSGFLVKSQPPVNVMVVRADRGRGKSAALGMIAAKLIQSQNFNVVVTAPRPEATEVLFQFAQRDLDNQEANLRFVAPDELIRTSPTADLLIVDEAAAIPIFMLEQLLSRYPRILFASTVHGYEGTGRGFDIRFSKVLDRRCAGWQQWRLEHPIRWSAGDPLERWVNQTFMLNAELSEIPSTDAQTLDKSQIRYVSQDELLETPSFLEEIYALLVQAHYRTSPGDLRDLLDGCLDLWVQSIETPEGPCIVGVLLLAKEGGLSADLGQQIWQGKRRPRGHLLPQYLSAQAGFIEATQLNYLRVVRIAIHPEYQSQGLGSQLLSQLDDIAKEAGVDVVGAMFAASADLMNFWRENGYQALRLGVSRDASSGSYTALVAKPVWPVVGGEQVGAVGKIAQAFCDDVRDDFHEQLIRQLPTVWTDLEPDLLFKMIQQTSTKGVLKKALSDKALSDVASFVFGHRGFDQVSSQLAAFTFFWFQQSKPLDVKKVHLLTQVVLQYHTISNVVQTSELTGKKQLQDFIKEALKAELTTALKSRGLYLNLLGTNKE